MDRLRQSLFSTRLWVLLVVIFAGHAAMYLALGTRLWLRNSLMATAFYGVALVLLRGFGNRRTVR